MQCGLVGCQKVLSVPEWTAFAKRQYALDKEKEQHALEQERVLYERARTARMDQSTEFDWAERTEPGLQDLAQADQVQPGDWDWSDVWSYSGHSYNAEY
jgi:hypothetical protein